MGALPTQMPDLVFSPAHKQSFGVDQIKLLFSDQQKYLEFFFSHLDYSQVHAFTQLCLHTRGSIFFSGVGKSGFIAQKISQTLVSTGTKAAFLNPTDALHGDIGIVGPSDLVVLFSKSGSTEELLRLVPFARAKGAFLVAVTCLNGSNLGKLCDMHVCLPLQRELCPFDLAPVTSTTIQMLFGDTVAIALMQAKNMTREEYALNHPAGRIGKRLILKVRDLMRKENEVPICKEGDLIMEQLVELTSKGCGCLIVVDDQRRILGTFTDGDLRRTLKAYSDKIFQLTIGEICNRSPRSIGPDEMAVDAMEKMEGPPSPVTFLPVLDNEGVVIGIVTLHDLVSSGL